MSKTTLTCRIQPLLATASVAILLCFQTSSALGQPQPIPTSFDVQVARLEQQFVHQRQSGTLDEAAETSHKLVSLMEKHYAPDSWQLKKEQANLASIEKALKLKPELLARHEKARQRYYAAELFEKEANYEKALTFYADANALFSELLGEQDLLSVETRMHLSRMQAAAGDMELAVLNGQKSVTAARRLLGASNPVVAYYISSLVHIELHRGKYETAQELIGEALDGMKKSGNQEHKINGMLLVQHAQLLNRTKKYNQAKSAAMHASSLLALLHPLDRQQLVEAQMELAQAYHGQGEHRECIDVCTRVGLCLQNAPEVSPDGNNLLLMLTAAHDSYKQLNRQEEAAAAAKVIEQLKAQRNQQQTSSP